MEGRLSSDQEMRQCAQEEAEAVVKRHMDAHRKVHHTPASNLSEAVVVLSRLQGGPLLGRGGWTGSRSSAW